MKREEGRCFKFYAPFLRSKTERLSEAVGGPTTERSEGGGAGACAKGAFCGRLTLKNFSR